MQYLHDTFVNKYVLTASNFFFSSINSLILLLRLVAIFSRSSRTFLSHKGLLYLDVLHWPNLFTSLGNLSVAFADTSTSLSSVLKYELFFPA